MYTAPVVVGLGRLDHPPRLVMGGSLLWLLWVVKACGRCFYHTRNKKIFIVYICV